MDEFESLNHTRWDCKYHVVFIPKYRRKVLYGELKRHLGPVFRQLAEQRESRVEEGHLMQTQRFMSSQSIARMELMISKACRQSMHTKKVAPSFECAANRSNAFIRKRRN